MKQTGNVPLLTFWCLLIVLVGWGLSWEVLRYQTGSPGLPAPTIPVFYRFLFAGLLFTTYVLVRDWVQGRNTLAFPPLTWGLIALLGAWLPLLWGLLPLWLAVRMAMKGLPESK